MIEVYEVYDAEEHIATLQVNGNRHKVELSDLAKHREYSFDIKSTEWTRPVPFFERILSEYYNDPYAVVLKDPQSNIVLYKVD